MPLPPLSKGQDEGFSILQKPYHRGALAAQLRDLVRS
jgi:hypothetical protein